MRGYGFLLLLLGFGACAPARPAPAPAPVPATPAPVPVPEAAPTAAPDRWWLLDAGEEGIHGSAVDRAYRDLLADRQPQRTVVVAVIDSGVDIEHEDLRANIWRNPDEVAGTGRDDDGNGYVDDVHGWNFIGGADGRNVDQDTYEVTRLYVELRPRFEAARADTLSPSVRAEYERFLRIRNDFETSRAEARETLDRVRLIGAALQQATTVLRAQLSAAEPTTERVAAIRSTRPDVIRARDLYLELAANDVTPEVIEEAIESFESQVAYGYNPDFDPRPIVGDNYDDPRERFYGNPRVEALTPTHGTFVAGIIAAARGNDIGVDGIATGVQIMPIRAVPDGDERDKDVANAIRYAVENGAHVINMSFGKSYSPFKEVVDEAVRFAESRGVLLVHAAGNAGEDLATGENYPNRYYVAGDTASLWIEVGASSWQGADQLAAGFSNYGRSRVDLFAPGADLRSTVPDNGYAVQSGTSFAAPVVSAVAALIMAYHPELDAGDVRRIILDTATRFVGQEVVRPGSEAELVEFCELSATCGVINAYEALLAARQRAAAMN